MSITVHIKIIYIKHLRVSSVYGNNILIEYVVFLTQKITGDIFKRDTSNTSLLYWNNTMNSVAYKAVCTSL